MEENKPQTENEKKWYDETPHARKGKSGPGYLGTCTVLFLVGLFMLALTIYQGEVLHILFNWQDWFFGIPTCIGALFSLGLFKMRDLNEKDTKQSLAIAITFLPAGIGGLLYILMLSDRPGITRIHTDLIEMIQPTANHPENYWIVKYDNGNAYMGMSKEYTYGSGRRSQTIRRPDGYGRFQWSSDSEWGGDTYLGMWKEGKRTLGLYLWSGNKSAYFGELKYNTDSSWYEHSGRGIYFYDDGYCTDGSFKDNKREGWGYHYYPDGNRLYALFKDSKITKHYFLTRKDSYVGWFKDSCKTGFGRYYYAQGGYYHGWFKDGKFNGEGRLSDANNKTLADRKWKMEAPDGENVRKLLMPATPGNSEPPARPHKKKLSQTAPKTDASGHFATQPDPPIRKITKYKGKLVNRKPEGKAYAAFDNGDTYNGGWHNGLREGYGEMEYANGDEYKGEWKAGKRTGKGYYFKGPKDYVKGDFVDGRPHGIAIHYVNDVRVYNGRWVNGKPRKKK